MRPLHFRYRNWQGSVDVRNVIPLRIYWGATEHHPEPQWLMEAYDLDKQDARCFAMSGILFTVVPTADEPSPDVVKAGWRMCPVGKHVWNTATTALGVYKMPRKIGMKGATCKWHRKKSR